MAGRSRWNAAEGLRMASAAVPVLLALAGATVTLLPPEADVAKGIWLVIFVLLGIAAFISIRQEQRIAARSHRRLLQQITGGDSFCYLTVDPAISNSVGGCALIMTATAPLREVNYWISPAEANRDSNNPLYSSVDRRKAFPFPVHEGTRRWDGMLKPGEYIVEYDATNGLKHWLQYLTISTTDAGTIQEVRIEHPATSRTILDITIP